MPRNHYWVPSTLGHGDSMCQYCSITNREAAVLNSYTCEKAPPSVPVPAETGTRSPNNPPPGTVGAPFWAEGLQPYQQEAIRQVMLPTPAPYVQRYGRGKRPTHGGKLVNMIVQEHKTEIIKQDPSLVEQLARRLETFASDQRAMSSRGRTSGSITEHRRRMADAQIYDSSAAALREAMTAQNKALYQVEINTILERFGVSETVKDEISLAIVKEFMG